MIIEQAVKAGELPVDFIEPERDVRVPAVGHDEAVAFADIDALDLPACAVGVQADEFKRGLDFKGVGLLARREVLEHHAGDDGQMNEVLAGACGSS